MELENPDNASSGVNIWKTKRSTSAQSATTSERILPFMKKIADNIKIVRVMYIKIECKLYNVFVIYRFIAYFVANIFSFVL